MILSKEESDTLGTKRRNQETPYIKTIRQNVLILPLSIFQPFAKDVMFFSINLPYSNTSVIKNPARQPIQTRKLENTKIEP